MSNLKKGRKTEDRRRKSTLNRCFLPSSAFRLPSKNAIIYPVRSIIHTRFSGVIVLLILTLLANTNNAQNTVTQWSFPSGTPADSVPDVHNIFNGNYTISSFGETSSLDFSRLGSTTFAVQATGWDYGAGLKYWQIEVNTIGYDSLTISSIQQGGGASPGPRDWKIQYQIGENEWTDIQNAEITAANNWNTSLVDNLPLPVECNGQSSLFFRWIMTSDTATDNTTIVLPTGKSKIDNIRIAGRLIPSGSPVDVYTNINICSGDSVYLENDWQFLSGTYFDTLVVPGANDTAYITTLAVHPGYLTIDTVNITVCDSYFAAGDFQNQSGIYYDSLFSISGCDSVIITHLSVSNPYQYVDTVSVYDTTFIFIPDTLTLFVTDTTYIVVYDSISVTDTLIIDVVLSVLPPGNNNNRIKIYPNPTHDVIYIFTGENYLVMDQWNIQIINSISQVVFVSPISQQLFSLDVSTFVQSGIYFVQLFNELGELVEVRKILLN